MVAVIESNTPGEGNRHVAGAHLVMAVFYGVGAAILGERLVESSRVGGFDDSATGICWVLGVLVTFAITHVAAARGARRKRRWARALSRALAIIFFPVVPVGTAFGLFIFRNTRPHRWVSE